MTMLILLFALVNLVSGKENFQVQPLNTTTKNVSTAEALQRCFLASLCTLDGGCCNGHGVCKVNGSSAPVCVCGKPQDCRSGLSSGSYPSYTGSTCNTAAIDSGCCKDGSDDYLFASSGVCNKRDGTDPESGSKGRLLKRIAGAWYNGTENIDSMASIFSMVNALSNSSRGNQSTSFNMMALGFLQVGIKDIVEYAYFPLSTCNNTFNGTVYPKVKHQTNTGITAVNITVPKQFENTATGVVDVGPLYDYATSISGGPYINYTPAVTYWNGTHHMTHEFILALKFYGLYHNYAARNIEEYFCGANSLSSPMSNTCTVSVSEQYQLARRSTIRFSQSLLQQAILQFVLENGANMDGLSEPSFDQWFTRDIPHANGGWLDGGFTKVRTHQEFVGGVTRADLSHQLISGLDFFISVRNPNINTTAWATFGSSTPCGLTTADIAADVINHFHTQTYRFGSRINSQYAAELANILTRVNELGLSSYKNTIDYGLTDTPSSSDISTHYNVFYGSQIETNSARQYASTASSVAVAATVALSDAIIADRTGYWAADGNGAWVGNTFHPNIQDIQSPSYGFLNCYKGGGSDCTQTSKNAAGLLTGQIQDPNFSTELNIWQSRGCLFAQPMDYCPQADQDEIGFDPLGRQVPSYQIIPEIINPLFYQYDGDVSQAFKGCDSNDKFLPNVITDAIPTSVGWSSVLDGLCFTSSYVQALSPYPACSRVRSSSIGGTCVWSSPF